MVAAVAAAGCLRLAAPVGAQAPARPFDVLAQVAGNATRLVLRDDSGARVTHPAPVADTCVKQPFRRSF